MVVIIPVTSVMPAMLMFIPPYLAFSPTALPGFVQFTAPMICRPAVVTMVLNCLMEFVFGKDGAPLTSIFRRSRRHSDQQPRR